MSGSPIPTASLPSHGGAPSAAPVAAAAPPSNEATPHHPQASGQDTATSESRRHHRHHRTHHAGSASRETTTHSTQRRRRRSKRHSAGGDMVEGPVNGGAASTQERHRDIGTSSMKMSDYDELREEERLATAVGRELAVPNSNCNPHTSGVLPFVENVPYPAAHATVAGPRSPHVYGESTGGRATPSPERPTGFSSPPPPLSLANPTVPIASVTAATVAASASMAEDKPIPTLDGNFSDHSSGSTPPFRTQGAKEAKSASHAPTVINTTSSYRSGGNHTSYSRHIYLDGAANGAAAVGSAATTPLVSPTPPPAQPQQPQQQQHPRIESMVGEPSVHDELFSPASAGEADGCPAVYVGSTYPHLHPVSGLPGHPLGSASAGDVVISTSSGVAANSTNTSAAAVAVAVPTSRFHIIGISSLDAEVSLEEEMGVEQKNYNTCFARKRSAGGGNGRDLGGRGSGNELECDDSGRLQAEERADVFSSDESWSDDEMWVPRTLEPILSCCVNTRANPDGWKRIEARRHAFERPLHSLQIAALVYEVVVIVLFWSSVFAGYLLVYTQDEKDCLAEIITFAVVCSAFIISLYVSLGLVSFKDCTDHDNRGEMCTFCRRRTHIESKHCKACNKCVDHFDHHCKWLNMCIGRKNYLLFFIFVSSACLATLTALVAGICLLSRHWAELERHHLYFRVGPIVMCAITALGIGPMLHLLCFHVYLCHVGETTYQYILDKREATFFRESKNEDKKASRGLCGCKCFS
ncbi:putative palmitoyl acyltransferase 7 [Leptomonas seymouri]|uniref:Palmitoyltransferase n=1 Tax=Leptomonas seymouri TaxID=5684 RepID=A0A0N1HWJ0_LEPSE|nr:putative palmitoyl acyltransferase 7 [Leptomonas seymouri]|eukprot:KPI85274.1 putative palmitoyl acyltransferase 7 [Leptomonas seymouri]